MDWIKKYGWYILIVFICSISGGGIVSAINHNNIGSLADWISGLCSTVAIGVAYYQIYEQKKEYENNKNDEKENKKSKYRAFFTVGFSYTTSTDSAICYNYDDKDDFETANKKLSTIFQDDANTIVRENKFLYKIENISDASVINVIFKIGYHDSKESECIDLRIIHARSVVYVVTERVFSEEDPLHNQTDVKYIEIYFDTLMNNHYVQRWNIEKSYVEDKNILDWNKSTIKEVSEEEIPKNVESFKGLIE